MPQIFQVLRCYKCLVFQVHQTKKANKWECKLCGEKQSVKRHYGLGTAKDCRLHVQKLNGMRGEIDELKCNQDDEENTKNEHVSSYIPKNYSKVTASKWSHYVEPSETNAALEEKTNDDGMCLSDAEVVFELPKKLKKFNTNSCKKNPNVRTSLKEVYTSNNINCDETHTVYSGGQQIDTKHLKNSHCVSKNLIVKEDLNHIDKSITKKKFVPPVLNKDSKWAQFTENTQEINENNTELEITPSVSMVMSQNDVMFSLCDDDDWDNILNI